VNDSEIRKDSEKLQTNVSLRTGKKRTRRKISQRHHLIPAYPMHLRNGGHAEVLSFLPDNPPGKPRGTSEEILQIMGELRLVQ